MRLAFLAFFLIFLKCGDHLKQPLLPLVLASGSPRRCELLSNLGLTFETDVSNEDEHFSGTPAETVGYLCRMKAEAVARRHENSLVLGSDTVVAVDGLVLGKPKDRADAERMLKMLSGRWHSVFTGVCVVNTKTGKTVSRVEETMVHFVPVDAESLSAYLDTKEPYDKAGAYAIQGMAGAFIDRIEGSYSNVVGLPMHVAAQLIQEAE